MDRTTAKFVISLDFELHWGVADLGTLECWKERLEGGRKAIPRLLTTFHQYGIHVTWATVGFLFFRTREELMAALPDQLPDYTSPIYSPYRELDTVGEGEESDPYHFAPSLIARIARTPNQEVGSHTFSHYYCLEEGQTVASFRADLRAAIAAAGRFGIELASLVFPRNQVSAEHLRVCAEEGIRAYRGTRRHWMYEPRAFAAESQVRRGLRLADTYVNVCGHNAYDFKELGGGRPLDVRASRYLRPCRRSLAALEPLRLRRICNELNFAARHGRLYHLWFHPEDFGIETDRNLDFLRRILDHFDALRSQGVMQSANMGEIAQVLTEPGKPSRAGQVGMRA